MQGRVLTLPQRVMIALYFGCGMVVLYTRITIPVTVGLGRVKTLPYMLGNDKETRRGDSLFARRTTGYHVIANH